jgi:hypothetical protein
MRAALVMLACCGDHATTVQYDDTGTLCLCASTRDPLCTGLLAAAAAAATAAAAAAQPHRLLFERS